MSKITVVIGILTTIKEKIKFIVIVIIIHIGIIMGKLT